MAKRLINTDDIERAKVWMEKPRKNDPDATKKMGRVRACVFHPSDKRCVGFIVKRPDLALMFHRKDLFVAYNGYDVVDGNIVVRDDPTATDKGACKALGINWDDCVLWVGLPVMCQDGTSFGIVGSVLFDAETGVIDSLMVSQGATANTLLGVRRVPLSMMRGFRRGMGAALTGGSVDDEAELGAILVDDAVRDLPVEGGVAEKAGQATAIVGDKAHKAIDKMKPKASEAAAAAGEAVNKGAYATGRQLKRASGMFSAFKEEYDKARHGDGADDQLEQPEQLEQGQQNRSVSAELSDDASASAVSASQPADEDVEYVFIDEDGNEVVFVDEDGNVITDPDLIDAEFEDAEDGAQTASAAQAAGGASGAKKTRSDGTSQAAQAVGDHLKKAGGMFSAFKEEYDKARRS